MFINKLKKAATSYKNEIAVLTIFKNYSDFIKNIKNHVMKKNELMKKKMKLEEEKNNQKPQILINGEHAIHKSPKKDEFLYMPPPTHQISLNTQKHIVPGGAPKINIIL
jgi:Leucine-rich repeat (LRR) protein